MTGTPYPHDLLKVMGMKLCDNCGGKAEFHCEQHAKYFCMWCGHEHVLNEHTRK